MWRGAQCAIFHQETTRGTFLGGVNSAQIKQDRPPPVSTAKAHDLQGALGREFLPCKT